MLAQAIKDDVASPISVLNEPVLENVNKATRLLDILDDPLFDKVFATCTTAAWLLLIYILLTAQHTFLEHAFLIRRHQNLDRRIDNIMLLLHLEALPVLVELEYFLALRTVKF